MRFDVLQTPISPDDPSGPDLDEDGDESYLNYVLSAPGRIPESFYVRDQNAPVDEARYLPFDRTSIDLKSEMKSVAELLRRTHDLRLLTLEARFQCLGGQFPGFCDCLKGVAVLIDEQWESVHPRGADGDFTMRQNTLSALDDQTSILLPLTYAPLLSSKKHGNISLRDHLLATGAVRAREEDREVEAADIIEAFQNPGNAAAVTALDENVSRALASLDVIHRKFAAAAGHEATPDFTKLRALLGQLRDLMKAAAPNLVSTTAGDEADVDRAEASVGSPGEASPAQRAVGTSSAVVLTDHAAAGDALLAVEQYFLRFEPSSPALILIHQARLLVGKPLVEALEALMPEGAGSATIKFSGGLQLDMSKMRAISDMVTASSYEGAPEREGEPFTAEGRPEAEQLINSVESFFRVTEPSSPVPMLIRKAKTFMNRDFSAILSDLIVNEG